MLAGLTVLVTGLIVWVALRGKQLGPVASAVLQGASVVLSIYGAIVFTQEGNDQHVKAAAKASARRVLVNYAMLGRSLSPFPTSGNRLGSTRRTRAHSIQISLIWHSTGSRNRLPVKFRGPMLRCKTGET